MKQSCRPTVLLWTVLLWTLMGMQGAAFGTTLLEISDRDLVRSSTIIATGYVEAISVANESADRIESRVALRVDQQLKGAPRTTLSFVLPGGSAPGVRRVVFGMPQFLVGEHVLVFLRRRPDGALTPTGLPIGKFTLVDSSDGVRARRQLGSQSRMLAFDAATNRLVERPQVDERPLQSLLNRIGQLVGEEPASQGEQLPTTGESGGSRWGAAFTFLGSPPSRWTQPDLGQPIAYQIDPDGDATLGAAASHDLVVQALAAWSGAGASVRLADGGPAAPARFNACDGVSNVQFNDPFGEIGNPVNCGGVLAIGGFCASDTESSTVNGVTFQRIIEGDVTMSAGFAGCAFWTATNLAEVLTHEFGHTLGLGHSSENPAEPNPVLRDATMYYAAHFDGRGASLRSDDTAGVQALYPAAQSPANANAVGLRSFVIDGNALVLNAIIRFPSDVVFQPTRDSITIELQDPSGTLYSGTVSARSLRPSSRRLSYTAGVSNNTGVGVVTFSWNRGNAATVVLRVQSAQFPVTSGQATLSLQLGEQSFVKQLNLQPSGGGSWVPS